MPEGKPCRYGDPTCPCQDGDSCHYEGENPMVPDLYRLAFIPGAFRCPKCQFRLQKTCISAVTGQVGTREEDRQSEPCPNDGTMMVHVTYREALEDYDQRLREELPLANAMRWLEEFLPCGVLDAGLELDGGIYATFSQPGSESLELREQNNLVEAIEKAKEHFKSWP